MQIEPTQTSYSRDSPFHNMMFDVDCPNTPDGNSPKATPARPPSVARRIANSRVANRPNIRSGNSYDRHRGRATSYDGPTVGLEPEEVIHHPQPRSRAPSAGAVNLYHAAPPANPSTPPSSNPFDDDRSLQQRGRTHSETWWKEEIVNESDDKGDVLDGYYGLSQKG